ncbi:unnamed protein product, partial [Closterium sp. NIES-53]
SGLGFESRCMHMQAVAAVPSPGPPSVGGGWDSDTHDPNTGGPSTIHGLPPHHVSRPILAEETIDTDDIPSPLAAVTTVLPSQPPSARDLTLALGLSISPQPIPQHAMPNTTKLLAFFARSPALRAPPDLWHKRLGHPSQEVINSCMHTEVFIPGTVLRPDATHVTVDNNCHTDCTIYTEATLNHKPFKLLGPGTNRYTKLQNVYTVPTQLLRSGVAIFDLDYDAILAAMYALSVSAEGDCYLCVPPDLGIEAAASRCSFRDSTTLTPLSAAVPVRLADPSRGPVLARSSNVLPCPAVPSGSLSGFQLPSFSTNLVSTAAPQDAMVTTTTPGGQRVSICTCTRPGRHLATFTRRPGSGSPVAPPPWSPSLPRLRGMHSRLFVSGLPKSLPPLPPSPAPPCLPCVEGWQRAAPHFSFPPTTAPLQTLHMDVWGPARISGQGRERYFLLVVDDYAWYTTVFPLRSKSQVPDVLIPWIRAVRLQLRERLRQYLPVLRQHSDRGGEFSSDLLRDFIRGEGILQSFTLPASTQQNRIAERRIGLVMEVAHTSMIHAAALAPCLLAGDLAHTALDGGGWRCVGRAWLAVLPPHLAPCLPSQDVMFDESVPFYRLFPYRSAPPPPLSLFLTPSPPLVDPLPPQGLAPSGVSQVDPLPGTVPVEVAVGSGAARGAVSGGAASRGAEPGPGGAEPESVEPGGAEFEGAESGGAEPRAVAFDVWLDDLQLFLQCDSKDGLSLFDLTSGASTAPAADADSTVRSQWLTRDAAARLAMRSHLPSTERAHFSQYKSAKTLYDAVVARYSSPATAALSRLMLPYLFPDLAAFATVTDLITHLRTSDTRYRTALPTEDHFLSLCPTTLTVDLLEERLLAPETSITAVGASRGDPRTPFFEGCSPVPLLPSVASATAVDLVGTESVSAASASSERRVKTSSRK